MSEHSGTAMLRRIEALALERVEECRRRAARRFDGEQWQPGDPDALIELQVYGAILELIDQVRADPTLLLAVVKRLERFG
jgi:hypothetical protein